MTLPVASTPPTQTPRVEPDWERAHDHPRLGPLRAGDLMASWIAHDLLHIRKIVRVLWEHHGRDTASYDTRYAGEW